MRKDKHVSRLLTLPNDVLILHKLMRFNILQDVFDYLLLILQVVDWLDGIKKEVLGYHVF
jgi:hypothetical protein